jgi:hypothetical protein
MKKTYDEMTLSAYIDGELDAATMNEVGSFLDKDPEAIRYVLKTVRSTALLRANMNAVLQEKIPQRLLDTLSSQKINRSRRKTAIDSLVKIAAVLILGFLGVGIGILMERNVGGNYPAVIAPLPAAYIDVVDAALEFNLSGKSRKWRTPRGSITVKVTPIKTYRDKSGVYYRQYKLQVATDTQQSQIDGLAYRAANGKWTTKALYFNDALNL